MNDLKINLPDIPSTRVESVHMSGSDENNISRSSNRYFDLDISLAWPSNLPMINRDATCGSLAERTSIMLLTNSNSSPFFDWEDKLLSETPNTVEIEKYYVLISNKNYEKLSSQVEKEFKVHGDYVTKEQKYIFEKIRFFTNELSKINFTDSLVELSPAEVFRFKLKLPNGFLLLISIPFENFKTDKEKEVVFSVLDNKQCLLSSSKNVFEFIKGINDYLE